MAKEEGEGDGKGGRGLGEEGGLEGRREGGRGVEGSFWAGVGGSSYLPPLLALAGRIVKLLFYPQREEKTH